MTKDVLDAIRERRSILGNAKSLSTCSNNIIWIWRKRSAASCQETG
ncbi:MAG: hypothetical protein ACOYVD_07105 [Bacillota bacterium]